MKNSCFSYATDILLSKEKEKKIASILQVAVCHQLKSGRFEREEIYSNVS